MASIIMSAGMVLTGLVIRRVEREDNRRCLSSTCGGGFVLGASVETANRRVQTFCGGRVHRREIDVSPGATG
jgi:hypothetical protein